MDPITSKATRLGNMMSIMHAVMRLILNRHMEATPSAVTGIILSQVMGVILSKSTELILSQVMGVILSKSTELILSQVMGVILSRGMGVIVRKVMEDLREESTLSINSTNKDVIISRACSQSPDLSAPNTFYQSNHASTRKTK